VTTQLVDLAAWLVADDGPIAEDEADARQWAKDLDRHWRESDQRIINGGRACGCQACIALSAYTPEDHDDPSVDTWLVRPNRLLAECAAKRAIVEAYLEALADYEEHKDDPHVWVSAHDHTVRGEAVHLIAQVFAGRPGWRPEWAS
jgi:hypothetical protein